MKLQQAENLKELRFQSHPICTNDQILLVTFEVIHTEH
jgi:hypothetical protein